jgi:hypothetical protein
MVTEGEMGARQGGAGTHDEDARVLVAAGAALGQGGGVGVGRRADGADRVEGEALLADGAVEDQLRAPPLDLRKRNAVVTNVLGRQCWGGIIVRRDLCGGCVVLNDEAEPHLEMGGGGMREMRSSSVVVDNY